jgi:hypothetical protein
VVGIPQAGLRGVIALGVYPLVSFAGYVWLLYGCDEITALLRALLGFLFSFEQCMSGELERLSSSPPF